MSRKPVAELWVHGQGALVHLREAASTPVPLATPAGQRDALQAWVEAMPVPAWAWLCGGLTLASAGVVLGVLFGGGFIATLVFGGMLTLGGGMTFFGGVKHRSDSEADARQLPAAAGASPAPTVASERCRRVLNALGPQSDATFEQLLGQLRWTEQALLATLLVLKENAEIEEDLNLETGEWVYRRQAGELRSAAAPSLTDRAQRGQRLGSEF